MRGRIPLALVGLLFLLAGPGAGCGGKKVVCPAGQTDCGGVCRDLLTDPMNCNACGLRCATGGICVLGNCQCPTGTQLCGAACLDTATSSGNCGSCGHACGAGTCSGGACTCTGGATDCGAAASPQCRDTSADRFNCGGCNVACPADQICASSACVACPAATPDVCGNACFDLQTDQAHCGTCGNACGAVQTCVGGTCTCPAGLTACPGGTCVDLLTDSANCGACGRACPAGQGCTSGSCACIAGQTCGALCCEGTACCGTGGTACQTKHDAGFGGAGAVFFDCNPAGSKEAAQNAALLWAPGGHVSSQGGNTCIFGTECVAWENGASPADCGVWCYAPTSLWAGKVKFTNSLVCLCPDVSSPAWH